MTAADTGETGTVSVQVVALEPVHGCGVLVCLAVVELVVEGVEIRLQGVQVLQQRDGTLVVRMPSFRPPSGPSAPGVVLPPELEDAVARLVLEEFAPGCRVQVLPGRWTTRVANGAAPR